MMVSSQLAFLAFSAFACVSAGRQCRPFTGLSATASNSVAASDTTTSPTILDTALPNLSTVESADPTDTATSTTSITTDSTPTPVTSNASVTTADVVDPATTIADVDTTTTMAVVDTTTTMAIIGTTTTMDGITTTAPVDTVPSCGTNLVRNPGFESGDGQYWSLDASGSVSETSASTPSKEGEYAFLASLTGSGRATLQQTIEGIEASATYDLEVHFALGTNRDFGNDGDCYFSVLWNGVTVDGTDIVSSMGLGAYQRRPTSLIGSEPTSTLGFLLQCGATKRIDLLVDKVSVIKRCS